MSRSLLRQEDHTASGRGYSDPALSSASESADDRAEPWPRHVTAALTHGQREEGRGLAPSPQAQKARSRPQGEGRKRKQRAVSAAQHGIQA